MIMEANEEHLSQVKCPKELGDMVHERGDSGHLQIECLQKEEHCIIPKKEVAQEVHKTRML